MNLGQLDHAEKEAQRFLTAVQELKIRYATESVRRKVNEKDLAREYVSWLNPLQGSRESASVRRASLDLSRALADLRRP